MPFVKEQPFQHQESLCYHGYEVSEFRTDCFLSQPSIDPDEYPNAASRGLPQDPSEVLEHLSLYLYSIAVTSYIQITFDNKQATSRLLARFILMAGVSQASH